MNPHLSSSGREFHERREGGKPGTELEEHPFLAGRTSLADGRQAGD